MPDQHTSSTFTWTMFGTGPLPAAAALRVVVVGAGMAGLTAARLLHDSGCRVTVVEARQRRGGRTWTDDSLGAPCDLGASWIHGADDNPLTNWCANLGIDLIYTHEEDPLVYQGGQSQRLSTIYDQASFTLDDVGERLDAAARGRSISLEEAAAGLITDPALTTFDQRVLAWVLTMAEGVEGAPARDIDARHWFPNESNMVNAMPKGGYRTLIDDAATSLDIRLGTPVTGIAYDTGGVTVATEQGPLQADAVVITVPLGILTADLIRFTPELPSAKQAALQAIGFGGDGVLNKVFMRFAAPFWNPQQSRLIGLPDAITGRGAYNTWFNLEEFNQAPILLSFSNGLIGAQLDRAADDDTIFAVAMARLQTMFGPTVPEPAAFLVTRWLSDPWARGSYSYSKVGTTAEHRRIYAQPVGKQLYFAGEAAAPDHYGTVHAALLAGAAAARQLTADHLGVAGDFANAPWYGPNIPKHFSDVAR